MDDVRGGFLGPPHGITPAAVIANKNEFLYVHCDIYENEKRGHTAVSHIESSSVTLKNLPKRDFFFTKNRLCIPSKMKIYLNFRKTLCLQKESDIT